MNTASGKTVLITGANTGLGQDMARTLALTGGIEIIYLACRDQTKAAAAKRELKRQTGTSIFKIVPIDTTDLTSVRAAIDVLERPLDALVMNAGGSGGPDPMSLTPDGVTQNFASNVLGHVVLLEGLIAAGKLTGVAELVGSEAARGVPKLRLPRPTFTSSSADEFASVIDGSYFHARKFSGGLAYGQVKYVGALWMAAQARRHPKLRLITTSPGNTSGTEVNRNLPLPARILARHILPHIAPALGIGHRLEVGTQRLIDGITNTSLQSGVFYASAANTLTGPVIDQAEIVPELRNQSIQDHADAAIHRFIN